MRKLRRHQPHQAVEHDFEHRQTLVGHHRRIDDGANAGIVVEIDVADVEAEQVVDFLLRQHPLAAVLAAAELAAAVFDHGGPLQRHRAGKFVGRSRFRGLRRILGIQRRFPLGGDGILVDLVVARHDAKSVSSLDDDFLEQHGADLVRRDRRIDAPGQFFLQAKQARRAIEIGRPQFAQIGLKNIGDARHASA